MRIAQVAPLFESVPPKYYGGTERVVSYLTEELVHQGHEVTLFASGDSVTKAHLVAACRRSLRLDKHCVDQLAHQILMLEHCRKRCREAYYKRTGDRAFIESIWPNVQRALEWIDRYGDLDGDGFVEYSRKSAHGLANQGWKDSHDAIFHRDGITAEGPIALCEVQGYVYAAKTAASEVAKILGDAARSRELSKQAEALSSRFEEAFWCEDLSTYALALDGNKRPCRVRTSNAGHCLFTGIATPEHARRVAATLTEETSFSGWGIRTVASSETRYNPMSYHNGSVWPHDNSLIVAGFARYGLKQSAALVLAGLLDASLFFDLHRLPELFCGFPRRPGESPTLYPVACAPQSWASAAIFLLLEACLGLSVSAPEQTLVFSKPVLPAFLPRVSIRDLRVGDARVDLLLTRHDEGDVGVNVLRRDGALEVVILK